MFRNTHSVLRRLSILLLLSVTSDLLLSANPLTETGESFIQERARQQELDRQKRSAERAQKIEPKQPTVDNTKSTNSRCFVINQIDVSGNKIISDQKIYAVIKPNIGLCMNKDMINQLLADVNKLYFKKGYITSRAYLPPQKIQTGTLKILIVESKIESININNGHWRDRLKLWMAMPIKQGDPLQLRKIEQGIDQINRVSSANASMKLWPGKTVGSSWVNVVSTPEDQWRGRVAMDNEGSETTGLYRVRLEFEADNILALNDSWGLFYIGSKDTNALSFTYGMPFRNFSFNYSYSYSEFLNFVSPQVDIFGQSENQSLKADYMLLRFDKGQTKLTSSITLRESVRRIIDVRLTPQKFSSGYFGVNQTYKSNYGLWVFDLKYGKGLTLLNSFKDQTGLTDAFPKAQFSKVDGSINLFAQLPKGLGYSGGLQFQASSDSLYNSDQINLGDRSTVRGFKGSVVSGDEGFYLRNEFNGRLPSKWLRANNFWSSRAQRLQWYTFLDTGRVKSNAGNDAESLTGTGIGLRYKEKRFSLEVSWGLGLDSSEEILDNSHTFYINASYKAF